DANDSCMASSARSKEPEIRIRLAMIRPDSLRKTDSAAEGMSAIQGNNLIHDPLLPGNRAQAGHRPNLDTAVVPFAASRDLGRPFDGLVQIPAVDYVIARELLLRFRERSVRHERFTVLYPNRRRGCSWGQRLGAPQNALSHGLLHYPRVSSPDLVGFVRSRAVGRFPGIYEHHIAHDPSPSRIMTQPTLRVSLRENWRPPSPLASASCGAQCAPTLRESIDSHPIIRKRPSRRL